VTTEMSTEAPTTKATTTTEGSTEAPVETTEKVVETTEEVVESSEAPVVTTDMEASTEKEGHGTTTMPDHMSTADPKDHGKGDHGNQDDHHGKPDGDHEKPDGDHGMDHGYGDEGNDHHYGMKKDHKPENMHGWATEDILKVLSKLGEMRRDTEDDAIAGNYFVGGDFVVNNGLINNNVAAVGGVHADAGRMDVPTLEFNRFTYCMVGEEKAMELKERDEAMVAKGEMYEWSLTEEVATITIGKMHEIYECMGAQWAMQTGGHMEMPSKMDMIKEQMGEHMKDEMKDKIEDHMDHHE